MHVTTKRVDYTDRRDSEDLVRLLSEYARIEHGQTLSDLSRIPEQLGQFPTAFSVLAHDPASKTAIGLVNCFFGFSTFAGRPLVNVHDVVVTQAYRGNGVTGVMLGAVERIAVAHDCCRLTLEVYANNASARRAYEKFGFCGDADNPDSDALFLRKPLATT